MDEEISMQGNLEINQKEGCVIISVNPKIYPLDVVLSSAYIFTDNYYVLVDGDPNEEIMVELRPKDSDKDLQKLGRDFNNELINYANYAVQSIRNEQLRGAILNRVLLTNNVTPNDSVKCNTNDYLEKEAKPWQFEDPEKIAVPWDEKYGESKDKQNKESGLS
ncbi:MAG: hypothetical protein L6408_05800 [Nanoarchaeota archaeon]|nr:hypothetical protein [Nanoarchaeota archaeon]